MKTRTSRTLRSLAAFLMLAAMLLSLAACGGNGETPSTPGTPDAPGTPSTPNTPSNPSTNDPAASGDTDTPTASAHPGKNTDASFSFTDGWPATGLINHYDSTTCLNSFRYLVVEGLWALVRSTGEIYCMLSPELPEHGKGNLDDYKDIMGEDNYDYLKQNGATEVGVTTGHIRPEAKWANGEDFIAKDVWAYYYMIHPTSSNYMMGVKVVDDKTVQFIWNPLKEPSDQMKNLLLAQDICGTVKYNVFAQFVDTAYNIVMSSDVNTDANAWGAFNRISNGELATQLADLRKDFYSYSPDWFISTGPFKFENISETQMLLLKNEYHWAADKIGFEKVKLYSYKELTQMYQMLVDGTIDYADIKVQTDTMDSMIAQNPDLVYVRVYDPGTIGITFNTDGTVFSDIRVRQAFNYILDRDSIKNVTIPYSTAYYSPLLGVGPADAKQWMSEEHYNALPTYAYDQDKAAELLTAAGWEKKDGSWYANGKLVELKLASPPDNIDFMTAAEATTAQLNEFGVKTELLLPTDFYAVSRSDDSPYDLCMQFTDLNTGFKYPTGYLNNFTNYQAKYAQLDFDGAYPDLTFPGLDGDTNTYTFGQVYLSLFSLAGDDMTYMMDVMNTGIANECLGITLLQSVTGVFYNVGKISGVPLEEHWSVEPNSTYVPMPNEEQYEDYLESNTAIMEFARSFNFLNGTLQPNMAK